LVPYKWIRKTQFIPELGLFYKEVGRLWRLSPVCLGSYLEFLCLCEELSGSYLETV
jgi:hypothetical protein